MLVVPFLLGFSDLLLIFLFVFQLLGIALVDDFAVRDHLVERFAPILLLVILRHDLEDLVDGEDRACHQSQMVADRQLAMGYSLLLRLVKR